MNHFHCLHWFIISYLCLIRGQVSYDEGPAGAEEGGGDYEGPAGAEEGEGDYEGPAGAKDEGNDVELAEDPDVPYSREDLAAKVVEASFLEKYASGLSFIRIISEYLQYSSGAARVALIKLISAFDVDNNYILSPEEIKHPLITAFANPDDAIAVTFALYDTNNDKLITRYELAAYNLLSESNEKTLYDIWKEVTAEFYEKDINGDNYISMDEYVMYDLYDIGKAIAAIVDQTVSTAG